jgi:hypothetical protein
LALRGEVGVQFACSTESFALPISAATVEDERSADGDDTEVEETGDGGAWGRESEPGPPAPAAVPGAD